VSIVEKALRKFQADRQTARAQRSEVPYLPPVIGQVVERTQPPASRDAEHATPIGRPSKIVHVDRDLLRRAGLLPPESQEHELANQYRVIKRPLIQHAFASGPQTTNGGPRQLIMMASALPGDGKTFTCINLSLSLSLEKDHSVLLVDADVAKPHISRVFGVEDEPGLLDVVTDPSMPVESAILPTDVPRLQIMPAGRRSETATELLASRRHREIVDRLAALNPRGLVLFDSPPLLLTSEARTLAALVGQVVVVVRAGVTPQQALKDTIAILGPDRHISLVLNQAEMDGPMSYYYGGSRYGYSHSPAGESNAPR
jgi:exopolysaccharide/PEP-CTERM locus tyrosine autokinase